MTLFYYSVTMGQHMALVHHTPSELDFSTSPHDWWFSS